MARFIALRRKATVLVKHLGEAVDDRTFVSFPPSSSILPLKSQVFALLGARISVPVPTHRASVSFGWLASALTNELNSIFYPYRTSVRISNIRRDDKMTKPTTQPVHDQAAATEVRLETVPGYGLNEIRTPSAPLLRFPPTSSQTSGPYFPPGLVREDERNLAYLPGHVDRALGKLIRISGGVYGEDGVALRYALVEIWQANSKGKYRHPVDDGHDAELDENFRGFGRCLTNAEGVYEFVTIKPGPYPVPGYKDWWRPPHIHFSVFGAGVMQRLITQTYFADEPLNGTDKILQGIKDSEARNRLVITSARSTLFRDEPCDEYQFDIVLRGSGETPFFDE